MVPISANLRQDPVKKVVDRLLVNAAVNEATRIKTMVPLPEQEAKQLAEAVIQAGQEGIVLSLKDVLGQQGGNLVALLEVVSPKTFEKKAEAKKFLFGTMKKKGRWKQLGNSELTFATRRKISGMETLPFASPEFLDLYGLKSKKFKYSAETFLFGAVEKLSENDNDDSENDDEKNAAKANEAKIRRIFKIIEKSQPRAAKKENIVNKEFTTQKIREKLQPLFDFNDKFEHGADSLEIFKQVSKLLPEYEAALEGTKANLLKEVVDGNLPWRKAVKRAEKFAELLSPQDRAITDFFREAIFKKMSSQIGDLGKVLKEAKSEIVPAVPKKREQSNSKRAQKSQTKYQEALKKNTPKIFNTALNRFGDVDEYVKKFAKYGGAAAKHLGRISLAYDIVEIVTASSVKQAVTKAIETGLNLAGTVAGAKIGAAFGSVAGPVGIFIGGMIGGLLGSFLGEAFAKDIVELATKFAISVTEEVDDFVKSLSVDVDENGFSLPSLVESLLIQAGAIQGNSGRK